MIAPVMPFLAEHLWRNLAPGEAPSRSSSPVARAGRARRRSCSPRSRRRAGSSSSAARRARRRGSSFASRCAGSSSRGAARAATHADEIARGAAREGGRVRRVEATELRVKPNLPVLGPKLGKELGAVRAALEAGEFEELARRRLPRRGPRALGRRGARRARRAARAGRSRRRTASPSRSTRRSTPSSQLEGRVLDLIHEINSMRKEAGLELTDRIVVTLPAAAPTCSATRTGSRTRCSPSRSRWTATLPRAAASSRSRRRSAANEARARGATSRLRRGITRAAGRPPRARRLERCQTL